jgi:putative transposase
MINTQHELSVRRQCEELSLHRSYAQYEPRPQGDDTTLANLIVEIYRQYPVYGYRRITQQLQVVHGLQVNRKKVLRIMKDMGLQVIYPKPCTTRRNFEHSIHPYLLRDMNITHPHQVWQTDITYLRTPHGFMYLNAFIDVYSRTIVGWNLSNTLDTSSCLVALERAMAAYGVPEIINTDQGGQYTSHEWISRLQEYGIRISMNGVGRSNDNAHIERLWRTIKYEGFVLFPYVTVVELKESIRQTIHWYNYQRLHSALDGQTPWQRLQRSLIKTDESTTLTKMVIMTSKQGTALYV